ncbi:MAG TPA: radical SAM protein [Clostridia bacterium]|nr:radical SAM protein [Clostridia bacterium]
MHYDEPVFRPPSEAFSLIIQVTIGCSHNACTFCGMYKGKKFRIKPWEQLEQELDEIKTHYSEAKRIFLADGNSLAMDTELLAKVLKKLYADFPNLERVSSYAGPRDLLKKTPEELVYLRSLGLNLLYLGVESGSDKILKEIKKGVDSETMLKAGRVALDAGFDLSVTIIIGLGGQKDSREHAIETGKLISAMDPTYLGALTLMLVPGTSLHKDYTEGKFKLLNPKQTLEELYLLVENLRNLTHCVFRSNHASNYLPLRGTLDRDRKQLLSILSNAIENPESVRLKPEFARGL